MKKSLRSIALDKSNNEEPAMKSEASNNIESFHNTDVEGLLSQYSVLSEAQLMNELLAVTSRQKAEGSFDPDALMRGMNAIAPMLTEEQRRRLNDIAGMLN